MIDRPHGLIASFAVKSAVFLFNIHENKGNKKRK